MHTLYKIIFLTILSCFFGIQVGFAQINEGGTPLSFSLEKTQLLESVSFMEMEFVDVEALKEEDRMRDYAEPAPYRFGHNIDVDMGLHNSGSWQTIKDEYKVWRLGIRSKDALSINLTFDDYHLPEGAKLFIYSADKEQVIGAFTHRNNQEDRQFAAMFIYSDEIIVEYMEPVQAAFQGSLNISTVTHGYRSVGDYLEKAFGSAGSCNMNVNCPTTDGWEDQIRSTAMLVSGSSGFCSGTLINNTNQDGTPLFLSANHCFSNPSTVMFWFNWESENCDNPSVSPDRDVMSGATTRSRNSASDFWLMEMNQEIPDDYNVYYSGWNRTTDSSIDGYIVGIHHPRGDIKKFSFTNDGVTASNYLGETGSGTTHWRVGFWEGGTTTEPGSSGSSLYDGNKRLIGQLHGGYAACGNTDEDWYGRLGVSWTGGGTTATRLSDWLDPSGTGVEVLDGYDPNLGVLDVDGQLSGIVSPSGSYDFGTEIIPEFIFRNGGNEILEAATIQYSINEGDVVSTEWTGSLETGETETITFPELNLPVGEYSIEAALVVVGDENPANNTRVGSFNVFDCSVAGAMPFSEDFEITPECWEIVDNQGNNQIWQFGTNNRDDESLPGSFGNYAFLDSDAFGNGNSQDSDLITPSINLSNYEDVTLSFDHYFRQYESSSATLSYSIDNGQTWTEIDSWTSSTSNPASFSESLPQLDGESEVKFKWNYVGNWDWYWSVDNVSVSGEQTSFDDAGLQVVHNSADPSLAIVDLYLNGELHTADFTFRSATELFSVPSMESHEIEIKAAGTSTSLMSTTHAFEDGEAYVFVITGLGSLGGFVDNPDGADISADIDILNGMHDFETAGKVMVYAYHSATDAPNINITLTDGTVLVSDLGYFDLNDQMLEFDADSYDLEIRHAQTNDLLFVFEADLSQFEGEVIGLMASGFVDPTDNQNGAPFSLIAVQADGTVTELRNATSTEEGVSEFPAEYELLQNYPNPFNPSTSIRYNLPESELVRLDVYNMMGQKVASLVNSIESAGYHTVSFDASALSSGVYIYRLQAGSFTQTKKMLLVK